MPRPKIEVSRDVLVGTITDAENEQTFSSRGALYEFIGNVLDVPAYVIRSRVLEWGLDSTLKTPLGKRGRPANPNKTASEAKAKVATPKTVSKVDTIPDWVTDLTDTFAEYGIEIRSVEDLLTNSNKSVKYNKPITEAWNFLREACDCPSLRSAEIAK